MYQLMKLNPMRLLFLLVCVSSLNAAETSVPKELIASLLPENPVVIEAGAQFGEDTEWMSKLWPKGTIHAFEPSPLTYPAVEQLAEKFDNVFSYPLALADFNGEMAFYLCGGASTLLPPAERFNEEYFHVDLDHPIFVRAARLEDWLAEQEISHVDFLWFDMEGNELNALKGAGARLKEVKMIYTEVNLQRFWEGCVLYPELKAWLKKQGFEEIWSKLIPGWQGNALFLNKKKEK